MLFFLRFKLSFCLFFFLQIRCIFQIFLLMVRIILFSIYYSFFKYVFSLVKIYCIFQPYVSSIKFNLSFNCLTYFYGSWFYCLFIIPLFKPSPCIHFSRHIPFFNYIILCFKVSIFQRVCPYWYFIIIMLFFFRIQIIYILFYILQFNYIFKVVLILFSIISIISSSIFHLSRYVALFNYTIKIMLKVVQSILQFFYNSFFIMQFFLH